MAEKRSKGEAAMFDGFQETIVLNGKVLKVLGKPLPPYEDSGFGKSGVLLVSEDETKMHCHICGRMFKNVGSHSAKVHGIYEKEYKDINGLLRKDVLMAPETRNIVGYYNINLMDKRSAEEKRRIFQDKDFRAQARTAPNGSSKSAHVNKFGGCASQVIFRMKVEAQRQKIEVSKLPIGPPTPKGLVHQAKRIFKTWAKAKAVASGQPLSKCNPGLRWHTKEDVLSAFKFYHETFGKYPYRSDLGRHGLPGTGVLPRLFGVYSLNAIKRELGWPEAPRGGGHKRKS